MEYTIEVVFLAMVFGIIIIFFFIQPTISHFKRKEKLKMFDTAPEFFLETQTEYKTYSLSDGQRIEVTTDKMAEDSRNIYPNGNFNFIISKSNITTTTTEYKGIGHIKIGEKYYDAFFDGREFFKPDSFLIHSQHFKDIRKGTGLSINTIRGDIKNGQIVELEIRYELWKYIKFKYDDKGELI